MQCYLFYDYYYYFAGTLALGTATRANGVLNAAFFIFYGLRNVARSGGVDAIRCCGVQQLISALGCNRRSVRTTSHTT